MKRIISLALFLSFTILALGQSEFAPAGASWHYRFLGGWVGPGTSHARYTGDTVMAGLPCKIIESYVTPDNAPSFTTQTYVHQSGDSLYYVSENGQFSSKLFLFKNNMALGETVQFEYLFDPQVVFTVVEKDTVFFQGGSQVLRYQLATVDALVVEIFDRFGPRFGFFDHWLSTPWDGNEYFLRCYEDDNFPLINISAEACGPSTSLNELPGSDQVLHVYPNPAQDVLVIELPANSGAVSTLVLFNAMGKIVLEEKIGAPTASIQIAHLPCGLYTGLVKTNDRLFPLKFVKN